MFVGLVSRCMNLLNCHYKCVLVRMLRNCLQASLFIAVRAVVDDESRKPLAFRVQTFFCIFIDTCFQFYYTNILAKDWRSFSLATEQGLLAQPAVERFA
jgi:hypothetical protein